jgi:hypothetical protein
MIDPDLLGQIRSNTSDPNPDPDVEDWISTLIFYNELTQYTGINFLRKYTDSTNSCLLYWFDNRHPKKNLPDTQHSTSDNMQYFPLAYVLSCADLK